MLPNSLLSQEGACCCCCRCWLWLSPQTPSSHLSLVWSRKLPILPSKRKGRKGSKEREGRIRINSGRTKERKGRKGDYGSIRKNENTNRQKKMRGFF